MARRKKLGEETTFMWLLTLSVAVVAVLLMVVAIFMRTGLPASGGDLSSQSSEQSSQSSSDSPPPSEPDSSSEEESAPSSSSQISSSSSKPSSGGQTAAPVPSDKMSINNPGTYTASATYRQIVISVGDVTLKNKRVTGDLFVMDNVSGKVLLENISVSGNIYVYGGDVTLRDVTSPNMRIESDGPVSVTAAGSTSVDSTLVVGAATISENGLSDGEGLLQVRLAAVNDKRTSAVSVSNARITSMTVTSPTRLTLSDDSILRELIAEARLSILGGGDVKDLVVRHNEVEYEQIPRQITVKRGFDEPKRVSVAYYPDEETNEPRVESSSTGGSDSSGASNSSWVKLSRPTHVDIFEQNGFVVVEYDHVSGNDGYYVALYVDGRSIDVIYTDVDQTSVNLFDPADFSHAKSCYVKVKALGRAEDRISDSDYSTSKRYSLR